MGEIETWNDAEKVKVMAHGDITISVCDNKMV